MEAPQLLEVLAARGVVLTIDGEKLGVTPRSALTDELRAEIRTHKPTLLELLALEGKDKSGCQNLQPDKAQSEKVRENPTPQLESEPTASTCTPKQLEAARQKRIADNPAAIARADARTAYVKAAFPDATQHGPDWCIDGQWYDRENALALVVQKTGKTLNGYPLDFSPRSAYDPDAATVEAWRMFNNGEVTEKERDNLLRYAAQAAKKDGAR